MSGSDKYWIFSQIRNLMSYLTSGQVLQRGKGHERSYDSEKLVGQPRQAIAGYITRAGASSTDTQTTDEHNNSCSHKAHRLSSLHDFRFWRDLVPFRKSGHK